MMLDATTTRWPSELIRNLFRYLDSYSRSQWNLGNIYDDYYWDIACDLDSLLQKGGYVVTSSINSEGDPYPYRGEELLNFMQYLLVYQRRLYLFFQKVPLNKVPLYIQRKHLKPFVLWRLENGI
jgi:hypothetical protein